MYERSAVVLERYFSESFYYYEKSRLKNNFENYKKLIEILEKYQDVSLAEDKIIKECEDIASQIKQIQKNQGSLYKKILKLQEDRNTLFENIDESAVELGKKLDKIEKEIDKCNVRMRPIDQEFIDTIQKFNEKSDIRSECGKKRRKIEKEYRNILENTTKNIDEIDVEQISEIKNNLNLENEVFKENLKNTMLKNGEKENVPFEIDVIESSINFSLTMYRTEAKVLLDVYEKANSLLNEINNNAVKIKKYKKNSKDSSSIISFVNAQKEYLTQFLDNERLSVGLGKKEHKRLMKDACVDFEKDVEQIKILQKLLECEISKQATKKMYEELYCAEYLQNLQKQEIEFENKVSKLNMVGKVLNPIYWRIESIENLYSVFNDIVTTEYQRDLSPFIIDEPLDDDQNEVYIEEQPKKDTLNIYESSKKSHKKGIKEEPKAIDTEIEYSNDFMAYYDNLDEGTSSDNASNFTNDTYNDDDSFDDDEFDDIYPNYRNGIEDDNFDDDELDDVYDDLETILKNRKKRTARSKARKAKITKKKGIFGLGNKKW